MPAEIGEFDHHTCSLEPCADGKDDTESTKPAHRVTEFLKAHHAVVTHGPHAEQYHVFVTHSEPAFNPIGPNSPVSARKTVDLHVPIGMFTLEFNGWLDYQQHDLDFSAHIKLPILPALKVAELKGGLDEKGISVEIGHESGEVGGGLTLYFFEGYLCLKFEVTILKQLHSASIKLIPFKI
ncbi:hypothetical protein HWV62_16232 [Athelia sp. TMB]|nr:hypothetical protein HWV62_16232 [Athelia sp. TMB]